MIPATMAITMMAMATKVPATFPGFEKKPLSCFLGACAADTKVSVAVGGAVGVTVSVLTLPVTVMTDNTGVGVQLDEVSSEDSSDEEDSSEVEDSSDVEELEGLGEGVILAVVVSGSSVIGLGTIRGVVETTVVSWIDGVYRKIC